MDRREFLKKTFGFAAAAAAAYGLARIRPVLGQGPAGLPGASAAGYDLVAVKNARPDRMFDAGIKALGGMEAFVRPGQTVVVKPNIGWDATPDLAATTNPVLVRRIIEHCIKAGAKKVFVFDNTCNFWERCYNSSGIAAAAKQAGATVVPGNGEGYYQSVTVTGGLAVKTAKVHESILGSDVFINVPILKHHGSSRLTISMKNLMGVVWDRGFFHANNLHQCIADFCLYRKPDLNVVDAWNVLLRNGPRGGSAGDVRNDKAQILSRDILAADTAATRLFGLTPEQVPSLKLASDLGVGRMDLEKMNIGRIAL